MHTRLAHTHAHLCDDPPAQCLRPPDEGTGQDELLRARGADQPGEVLRAAGAREDANLGQSKGRVKRVSEAERVGATRSSAVQQFSSPAVQQSSS
jgi:hypothetical protein